MRETMTLVMVLCLTLVGVMVYSEGASVILQTELYIDPTPLTVRVCNTFIVDINIRNVIDLAMWEIELKFDPTQLECLGATEGPFLKSHGLTLFAKGGFNNVQGYASAECALVSGGADGSGTLVHIEFHCKGVGESDLFTTVDTYLWDSSMSTIPFVPINGHVIQQPQPVGGVSISVENSGIGGYIGIVSAILATTIAAATYSKHIKRKKLNQQTQTH